MSFRRIALALAVASLAGGVAPSIASADVDPVGCTQTLGYDNTIPTWDAYFAAHPDPKWVARPGTSLHRLGTELDDQHRRRVVPGARQPDLVVGLAVAAGGAHVALLAAAAFATWRITPAPVRGALVARVLFNGIVDTIEVKD